MLHGISMKRKILPATLVLLLLGSMAPLTTGYGNGIYNQGSGCGGGYCHGSNTNAVVSMSGHPASYTPGQSYTLSISVTGGASTNHGGFSLDVNTGTLSAGGIGIMAVKVNSGGNSATHTTNSYRSWSIDWIAPTSGSGVAIFDLAGNAVDGNNQKSNDHWDAVSYQVPEAGAPSNNPPSASNLQFSPSSPVTTDTLSLTYSYQDPEGDLESGTTIHWYKDGVLESSRNNQTTVPSSLTTKGESWNATVIPSDGMDDGSPVNSANLVIANSIPNVLSASLSPSDATESDNLTMVANYSDADNDLLTFETEWYVDDTKISAFDNDISIPSVAIRDGDVWFAKIRVNDGEVSSVWFTTQSISIGSDNTAPNITSVSLGGPYTTIDDLIATAVGDDADGDLLTYEWEWESYSSSQWTSTAFTTDTVPASQTNKEDGWRVKCRVTDGKVHSEWMTSNPVYIDNTPPVLSSFSIDQDSVYFQNEVTYTYEASDVDGDVITTQQQWQLNGDILTLILTISDGEAVEDFSDTVLIMNSPPTASYDGMTTQDALTDLNPLILTDDANGDSVDISWTWLRNGFTTDFNQSLILSSNLGAGDTWTAIVTPNDGMDDGQTLVVDFTISNTAPVAVIKAPEVLLQGSKVTFSAEESTDIDGAVVNAIWSIDGVVTHNGMMFTTTMREQATIGLKVVDDMGAIDSASQTFNGEIPPYASNTVAEADGNEIVLSWDGDASEWAIVHNGEVIDTTTEKKYRHAPTMEGKHTYAVMPIVDGQQIEWSGNESTDSAELNSDSVPDKPGPSETAGMIFSIILLIAGLAGVAVSFIPRRD